MTLPKTKVELIELSNANFNKLNHLVNSFTLQEQSREFPKGTMSRNIRDVLAHLHQLHLMMLEWYQLGMQAKKPAMPAKGYTWKTVPELNQKIWEKYLDVSLEKVKHELSTALFYSFRKSLIVIQTRNCSRKSDINGQGLPRS